jgi:hypothetical protein
MGRRDYMPSDLLCERIPEDLFCNAKVFGVRSPKSLSSISRSCRRIPCDERAFSPYFRTAIFSTRSKYFLLLIV